MIISHPPALLALEDGSIFQGISVGATGEAIGEVVFNTAMTGYQEIITDPSYAEQIVTLSSPHIGNIGTNSEDEESRKIWMAGLVIRNLSEQASNWRSELPLDQYLKKNKLVTISEIDTRRLTRILQQKGALRACIQAGGNNINPEQALEKARACPSLHNKDLAKLVSTDKIYTWPDIPKDKGIHIIIYDFGVKYNTLRLLALENCRLTIVPAQTPVDTVLKLKPQGVLFSSGPGDPAACSYAIEAMQALLNIHMPIFGLCLGYQILALACGAKTIKMKFGHHGANHPVQELKTGRVLITSQNHGFAVEKNSLPPELEVSYISLFDDTLQGIKHRNKPAFGFQGHPEASPGPRDLSGIFKEFVGLAKANKV